MIYAPLRDYTNPDNPCQCRSEGINCDQGRRCPANMPAEPCTELGADDVSSVDTKDRARFWQLYLAAIAVVLIATAAVYWPH